MIKDWNIMSDFKLDSLEVCGQTRQIDDLKNGNNRSGLTGKTEHKLKAKPIDVAKPAAP